MLTFSPKRLTEIQEELARQFPLPADFALKDETYAQDAIAKMRESRGSFLELSPAALNCCYQLAALCTDEEFLALKNALALRMTSNYFEIGWIYCQIHPENTNAVSLFCETAGWMKRHKPAEFRQTLIGRTGLPWDEIFDRSAEIMRAEKLSVEDFCEKFEIRSGTSFYERIQLAYLSKCEKSELLENEELFARLIGASALDSLRPAIKNYTAKVHFEEMSELVCDALSCRLAAESKDETLGLSPNMLKRLRSIRFCSVIGECVSVGSDKGTLYNTVSGMARNIELLNKGFFAIDFGNYIVLDNSEWDDQAYAYLPQVYGPLFESWKEKGYPEDYWPAADPGEIADAREIVLGINKAGTVRLGFSGFELLYTRDLLSLARY